MSPVGRLVFNTSEVPLVCLVGSTPTSSAIVLRLEVLPQYQRIAPLGKFNVFQE